MTRIDLQQLFENGDFESIDLHFGKFLMRSLETSAPETGAAGMLLMQSFRRGDSCIELKKLAGTELAGTILPEYDLWQQHLPAEEKTAPVILDSAGRLYLHSFYRAECEVACRIAGRLSLYVPPFDLAPGALAGMHDYFQRSAASAETDLQQAAVYAAGGCGFSLITGGPGTGKTTVIAALLALELQRNPALSIALAAPTGKAQARMKDALKEALAHLHISEETRALLELLPSGTIHSYLAPRGDGSFRFNETTPLPYDLLIVDECSMIPVALMAAFLKALRPDTRLVLLGDKDQLSAVEAGSVLADLYASAPVNVYPRTVCDGFQRATGWKLAPQTSPAPVITELMKTHRFASAPTLGRIAGMIRSSEFPPEELADFICTRNETDFRSRRISCRNFETELLRETEKQRACGFRLADLPELARKNLRREAFALFDSFRILNALREGEYGVANANRIMRKLLALHAPYAPGMPLMILRNDRRSGLHNGDIGLVCGEGSAIRVCFPETERTFQIAELPEHETVFAMTIHKSQGSGFDSVLLILPEEDTPVLSRELVYTGITRAKHEVELWSARPVLAGALARKTLRSSGLTERLKTEYGQKL